MTIEIHEHEVEALRWLLNKGLEITKSDRKYDIFCDVEMRINEASEKQ